MSDAPPLSELIFFREITRADLSELLGFDEAAINSLNGLFPHKAIDRIKTAIDGSLHVRGSRMVIVGHDDTPVKRTSSRPMYRDAVITTDAESVNWDPVAGRVAFHSSESLLQIYTHLRCVEEGHYQQDCINSRFNVSESLFGGHTNLTFAHPTMDDKFARVWLCKTQRQVQDARFEFQLPSEDLLPNLGSFPMTRLSDVKNPAEANLEWWVRDPRDLYDSRDHSTVKFRSRFAIPKAIRRDPKTVMIVQMGLEEAFFFKFMGPRNYDYASQLIVGGINALTGEPDEIHRDDALSVDKEESRQRCGDGERKLVQGTLTNLPGYRGTKRVKGQNYVVSCKQGWLDGFVDSSLGDGIVKQFVAKQKNAEWTQALKQAPPLTVPGQGQEEQEVQRDRRTGLTLRVFPPNLYNEVFKVCRWGGRSMENLLPSDDLPDRIKSLDQLQVDPASLTNGKVFFSSTSFKPNFGECFPFYKGKTLRVYLKEIDYKARCESREYEAAHTIKATDPLSDVFDNVKERVRAYEFKDLVDIVQITVGERTFSRADAAGMTVAQSGLKQNGVVVYRTDPRMPSLQDPTSDSAQLKSENEIGGEDDEEMLPLFSGGSDAMYHFRAVPDEQAPPQHAEARPAQPDLTPGLDYPDRSGAAANADAGVLEGGFEDDEDEYEAEPEVGGEERAVGSGGSIGQAIERDETPWKWFPRLYDEVVFHIVDAYKYNRLTS